MHEYFGILGYAGDCATDAATTNTFLRQSEYLLVIADLHLGGSGDRQELEIVKCAHEQHPNTQIVLLTAEGLRASTAQARRLGVNAC